MQSEHHVISMVTFKVTDRNSRAVAETAGTVLQQRLPQIPGFVEGTVLASEDKTRIVVLTEWESRECWADAEWDGIIGNAVSRLFEETASYDVEFFFPFLQVRANRKT